MDYSLNVMAINYSYGNDDVIVPIIICIYRGLSGDDVYILTESKVSSETNSNITIIDSSGLNKIQLVDGFKFYTNQN